MRKQLTDEQVEVFRERLLRVAEKLFAKRGVAGVSMRQIAQALGYSQSFTIYDRDDQKKVIKKILKDENEPESGVTPDLLRFKISDYKNLLLTPADARADADADARAVAAVAIICGRSRGWDRCWRGRCVAAAQLPRCDRESRASLRSAPPSGLL